MACPSSAQLPLPRRPRRKPSSRRYNAPCAYSLVIRTWIAFNAAHCAKQGRILRRPANTTYWPGEMHQRFRPYNRYLSKLRDNVITTGFITATAAADNSSGVTGLRSNLVTFGRKRPTAAKRTGRNGPKGIGGGKDEDRERTRSAIVAVHTMDCPHPPPGQASNQGEASTSKGPSVSLITPAVQLVTTRNRA
jgi:hypothetical protein